MSPLASLVEIADGAEGRAGGPHLHRACQRALLRGWRHRRTSALGIERAIAKGWLWRHESGTYLKFTHAGAALFA
jgi:hypothetical protein